MVFYLVFPLYISLSKLKNKILFYVALLLSILPAIYITFYQMDPTKTATTEFRYYINPLNQLFLFAAGVWIAYYFSKVRSNYLIVRVLAFLFSTFFVLYPIPELINLFTGGDRFILCFICIVICACVYKIKNDNMSPIVEKPLSFLGDTSYSIYLLHPITYLVVTKFGILSGVPAALQIVICIVVTLGASYLVYTYVEKPAMKFGKDLVTPVPLTQHIHDR